MEEELAGNWNYNNIKKLLACSEFLGRLMALYAYRWMQSPLNALQKSCSINQSDLNVRVKKKETFLPSKRAGHKLSLIKLKYCFLTSAHVIIVTM